MLPLSTVYPEGAGERDAWIVARRGKRNDADPARPHGFFVEDERTREGEIAATATVFLTNRECPWRCLMCDLWRNTLTVNVPAGAILQQIDYALERLPAAKQIKLYNSGSFFDPRAIPTCDYEAIAQRLRGFESVIVECHPALAGDACLRFRDSLAGRLEVAVGLETVHPEILPRLNKRMTLAMFQSAAEFLRGHDINLRAFVLVKPPFMREEAAVEWASRSVEFAFACGAGAATLIPTRAGNGAMEALAAAGDFAPPRLRTLEQAAEQGVSMSRGRVFADLWDAQSWFGCAECRDSRIERLHRMNLTQTVPPSIVCAKCAEMP